MLKLGSFRGSKLLQSQAQTIKRSFSLPAHGTSDGQLVNRLLDPKSQKFKEYWSNASNMYEINLTHRHLCDIELLMNGAFSPLEGFMTKKVYDKVVHEMHLPNGTIFPIPITLDITEQQASEIEKNNHSQLLLRDGEYNPIAVMDVEDIWRADKKIEAEVVFGGDPEHPAISYLNEYTKNIYVGGKLYGFQLPPHYDYSDLRKTPQEVRELFKKLHWNKVVGFQTRNPMHRAHFELTKLCLDNDPSMNVLVHPVVGMTKPGDIDHHTRVKCYRHIMPKYPKGRAELVVFPLAMRMGGPREAIWHSIIRKNFGLTHFILGRDHAGPGANSKGKDFYGPYEARDAAIKHQKELGLNLLAFENMLYSPEDDTYYQENVVPKNKKTLKLSGTEVRKRLRTGEEIPEWFSFKEVVTILRQAHPPRHRQGFVIFFTGLSGSGKSTIANALREKLMEIQDRRVAMLDGDHVRKLLSSELTFSKEHRNLNIKRIGYIASMIANTGGIVIACPIAPYKESRDYARATCTEVGGYCEVYCSTPVSTCEQRDRKGLYLKAKEGKLPHFTGISDPYEVPEKSEISFDTTNVSIKEACDQIISWLAKEGYVIAQKEKKEL